MKNSAKILSIMFFLSVMPFIRTNAQIGTPGPEPQAYKPQKELPMVNTNMVKSQGTHYRVSIVHKNPGNINVSQLRRNAISEKVSGLFGALMFNPASIGFLIPINGIIIRAIELNYYRTNNLNPESIPVLQNNNHVQIPPR